MIHPRKIVVALLTLAVASITPRAIAETTTSIDVEVNKPGPQIPPNFFGLMTEEINHSYDGGLYAELIQNRTFQDPQPRGRGDELPVHWSVTGSGAAKIDRSDPVNSALLVSLRLELSGGEGGIANDGYWGIPVKPDTTYTATFYAKGAGGFAGNVTASIRTDERDAVVASAQTPPISADWKKYTVTLKAASDAPTTAKARFVLFATGNGSVSFSYVSLFPPTYQDAPNGLRPDLMQLLAQLRPKFIRLPGGNYVEGDRFSGRFNWKKMIGPPDQRPGHMGCWSYRSSDGFGMPEFLLWCKQLNAEPVLALFAGYVLNRDHFDGGSPEMAIYTQEALEEIEYVMGPADSVWGKRRAADGFPDPFPLHYVEIGNEDWADGSGSYDGRFTQMAKAIRQRYPQLKIIATAPVKSFKPDLYDDHYYRSPRVLREMFNTYDMPETSPQRHFDGGGWNTRHMDGIKTFVGEWAAQEASPITNHNSALADAAFVMGMERNCDAVEMQCYAPLFANVNLADTAKGYPRGWQWNYNLIGYDALGSFGSPSFYAQSMLSQNKGDVVLPTKLTTSRSTDVAPTPAPHGAVGVGTWHTDSEYKDIVVTDSHGKQLLSPSASDLHAWKHTGGEWQPHGGAVRSANTDQATWAVVGDPKWTDYTIRLKARKISGNEGFLVLFHVAGSDDFFWWNVGGWDNTRTQIEDKRGGGSRPIGQPANFTVEADKWYDLRVEVKGPRARCFIDDRLISEADEPSAQGGQSLFATAAYDNASHQVIVNMVNVSAEAVTATLNLRGAEAVSSNARAIVLSGAPQDVNSVENPTKVSPREQDVPDAAATMQRTFAPHSLTILRINATTK